ncbi:MAG TPA: FecR domain-containing protein, partial [Steroidobacter sp.]
FFKVTKDASRPFTVHAGRASVAAVGTEFNVRRGSDHVTVYVVEGRVLVEPTSAIVPMTLLRQIRPGLAPVMVHAGEETAVDNRVVESVRPISDVLATTSWQTGQLAFRMQPLRFVLEDVNRYATKPIVLADPALGDLKITGTVAASNVSGWVASLKAALDIVAIEEPDRIVLRATK